MFSGSVEASSRNFRSESWKTWRWNSRDSGRSLATFEISSGTLGLGEVGRGVDKSVHEATTFATSQVREGGRGVHISSRDHRASVLWQIGNLLFLPPETNFFQTFPQIVDFNRISLVARWTATIIDIDISIYIFKSIYARDKLFQYLVFEVRK